VNSSAGSNRAWVRQRVKRAGLAWETELRALAVAVFLSELEAPDKEQQWLS
jgi:hypothetical protein